MMRRIETHRVARVGLQSPGGRRNRQCRIPKKRHPSKRYEIEEKRKKKKKKQKKKKSREEKEKRRKNSKKNKTKDNKEMIVRTGEHHTIHTDEYEGQPRGHSRAAKLVGGNFVGCEPAVCPKAIISQPR